MGDDGDDAGSRVPWRSVVLWMCASSILGISAYLYGQADFVKQIREEQIRNSNKIAELTRSVEVIESTKTDRRFRSDDWDRERRILDQEFKGVWKAIDDCRRPITK